MNDIVHPYIGVTGIMTPQEARAALRVASTWESNYRVMLDVLASSKTLSGRKNKWPNRYPNPERIAELFVDHPKALNFVHYSTDTPEYLAAQLLSIAKLAGPHLHGFQLNVVWPEVEELMHFHLNSNPVGCYQLVLQLGTKAIDQCTSLEDLVARVTLYKDLVQYILLDCSGGKGIPFDVTLTYARMEALREACPWAHIVVAGGLSGDRESFSPLEKLISLQEHLSCDAEGRLRTHEDDDLNVTDMQHYLRSLHLAFARGLFGGAMR